MVFEQPENEEQRLRILREFAIVDTPPEQVYDDVTMLASRICEAPIALISISESERQWFKSRIGLAETQVPREHSFCAHAILKPDEVMIVPDALADARFVVNPLVYGEANVRFYAGAPLVISSGEVLGTLCVMDRVPRVLNPEQIEVLRALVRQVVTQLELRRLVLQQKHQATELSSYQRRLEDYQLLIERANAEIEVQNATDPLTGLLNRRAFNKRMEEEGRLIKRNKYRVSLLMLEVDDFESYENDFGRTGGDDALHYVAGILRKKARRADYVARYSGGEFAVVLTQTGSESSIVIAERLRRAIETGDCPHRPFTVSIGADTSSTELEMAEIVTRAHDALQRARQQGANRVVHIQSLTAQSH